MTTKLFSLLCSTLTLLLIDESSDALLFRFCFFHSLIFFLPDPQDLTLDGTDAVTEKLKVIAARAGSSEFQYSKFFSIGLFQMLQQSGQTDPDTFTALRRPPPFSLEVISFKFKFRNIRGSFPLVFP